MTDRYISLHDISPKQREITCMPFGIVDHDNELVKRLYDAVYKQHKTHPNKPLVLKALEDRHNLVLTNRHELAKLHILEVEKVEVIHQLTGVLPFKNNQIQILTSDVVIPLTDGFMRFRQPRLCFFINEDNKTWEKVVKYDEHPLANSNGGPGEDSDLAQAIQAAKLLQKNFTSRSKQNTTLGVSSVSSTQKAD